MTTTSWQLAAPTDTQALDLASVSLLLDAPREEQPARAMLAFLNRLVPVEFISLVSYVDEVPTLLEGHAFSPGVRNVTAECFAQYRRQFFGLDQATGIARVLRNAQGSAAATVTGLYCDARDIPDADWRAQIYDRQRLTDRMSLLYCPSPGTAFAINLYRNQALGRFGPQEIERLLAVAPLLRQVHRNAVAAIPCHGLDTRVALARGRLRDCSVQLSERELDVCARIACGMTADGIAAQLDIAPSTVLTLRKRAYRKLDIHDRVALVRLAG